MRTGVLMISTIVMSLVSAYGQDETGSVDWAALDPDVSLIDCIEPCVRLSDRDLVGSCAEIRQMTDSEGAKRIGSLREIGVSATELEGLNSLIGRNPSRCEGYLINHFAGLSSSAIQKCDEDRDILHKEAVSCLASASLRPDATGTPPNCVSDDAPDASKSVFALNGMFLFKCMARSTEIGGEAGSALRACATDDMERWSLIGEDSDCKLLAEYMSIRNAQAPRN